MATKKLPRPDLSEEDRQKRQEEVYRLHCRGLTVRAIGAELRLDVSQVQRALVQAKAAIRKVKGEKHLADLAHRLVEGAFEDLSDSWRICDEAEETVREALALEAQAAARAVEAAIVNGTASPERKPEAPEIKDYFRTFAAERLNRVRLRDQIAKFSGLDPIKTAELELKQRLLRSGEDLLTQLVGQGWVCAPPGEPC